MKQKYDFATTSRVSMSSFRSFIHFRKYFKTSLWNYREWWKRIFTSTEQHWHDVSKSILKKSRFNSLKTFSILMIKCSFILWCASRLTSRSRSKCANYSNSWKVMKIASILRMRKFFSNMKMKITLLIWFSTRSRRMNRFILFLKLSSIY